MSITVEPIVLGQSPIASVLNSMVNWVLPRTQSEPEPELPVMRREGPRDCALVLDVSPSMEAKDWKPTRLAGAQNAAKTYCARLGSEEPEARVAIISYGGRATACRSLTPAYDQPSLVSGIESMSVIGSTNITAGLQAAHKLLEGSPRPCQVVLLTDGEHNKGVGPRGIAGVLRQYATLEIVGIGGSPADVNESLLREIASAYPDGSKRYRWIGDPERLEEHFHRLAGGLSRE